MQILSRQAVIMLNAMRAAANFPYLDTRGKTTIAIGRNLSDRGLADDEIEYLFATDLGIALSICCDLYPAFHRHVRQR